MAVQYDIAIWVGRVPTQINPSDILSRDRQLSFATEPSEDLASLDQPLSMCDLSWALFQKTEWQISRVFTTGAFSWIYMIPKPGSLGNPITRAAR